MLKGNWTNEGTLGADETHYIYAKFDTEMPDLSGVINSRNLTTDLSSALVFKGHIEDGIWKLFFYKNTIGTNSVAEAQITYIDENNLNWEIIKDPFNLFPSKTILSSTSINFDYKI